MYTYIYIFHNIIMTSFSDKYHIKGKTLFAHFCYNDSYARKEYTFWGRKQTIILCLALYSYIKYIAMFHGFIEPAYFPRLPFPFIPPPLTPAFLHHLHNIWAVCSGDQNIKVPYVFKVIKEVAIFPINVFQITVKQH